MAGIHHDRASASANPAPNATKRRVISPPSDLEDIPPEPVRADLEPDRLLLDRDLWPLRPPPDDVNGPDAKRDDGGPGQRHVEPANDERHLRADRPRRQPLRYSQEPGLSDLAPRHQEDRASF